MALLVLVWLVSFLGAFAVSHVRSSDGFDGRVRPDHMRTYSNAALRFALVYPAQLTLADFTNRLRDRGHVVARLVFTDRTTTGALVVTVRFRQGDHNLTYAEAARLVRAGRSQVAASLPSVYEGQGDVRRVTVQNVSTTTVDGLPAIASRAQLRLTNGRTESLERDDCFGPALSFEFEALFSPGDVNARDSLRRIVVSFRQESSWPPAASAKTVWAMVESAA